LDTEQLAVLEASLDAGPAAHGWLEDQRWTLARVTALIKELFGVDYTFKGVWLLLHRIGFTPQVPLHRATECNEPAVADFREQTWPQVKEQRGSWVHGSSSPTSPVSR
jgi:putative transposase